MSYDHKTIESKWQTYWDEHKTFKTEDTSEKPKYYVLDMFPYPSGAGLHVGHPLGYIATDIVARYKRMQGFNVLHPMGWDAFGLPAEQYAIQTGTHPSKTTAKNIVNFRRQIKMLGFSYDWEREINTTDPDYYKWTQWIFLQLFNKGLAYQAEFPVNWCPELKTVLANEEVIDGKSERGGHPVKRVPMKQWMLKITDYAESLLNGLDDLDWPDHVKDLQRNWIGRSEGADVDFKVENRKEVIRVFTTRPDTLFGATYMVLSPEHPLVETLTTDDHKESASKYRDAASLKSDLERGELNKDKSGIFTGTFAINPVNGEKIPIWIADYVLMSYGTGAIMAVPGQDQRDWDFASKFDLPIIRTVNTPDDFDGDAFLDDGPAINSDFLNGLKVDDAKSAMINYLEENKIGKRQINYKLRDWLFSRQRYWGEPFPLVHAKGKVNPISEDDLPVLLPEVEKYKPSGTGDSPLANITDWVEMKDDSGNIIGLRETHTMPQWAGSCWYYLRYIDPLNTQEGWNSKKEQYWMPVDLYIGGQEHAVLHLMYARFWHHVLYDLGFVSTKEPFQKLFNQGMILGNDGSKMSKSKGNVINPDEIVDEFGADAMRLYEMFMGPLDKAKPWSETGLQGCSRFLNKILRLIIKDNEINANIIEDAANDETIKLLHQTIKKVTYDIENLDFNTAISQMMIFTNHLITQSSINRKIIESFTLLLNPFVPHVAEEIWNKLGHTKSITYESWPNYDQNLIIEELMTIAVQVNGKLRASIEIDANADKDLIIQTTKENEKISQYLDTKEILNEIYVTGRLVNFVIK
ncbi:MAG: leucine--tRNA ligase [Candidatus Marinimicrobia bacterium]|jgi:leucyl-tRNA synthetase|nr:leucine--tRNA ligase [Candidatus Neomarinimicrobiota bacterium]MBT3618181.1 leucine--tRNA ligase [Candidatus Neomarinimicrobiota bacterium]MBT3828652.1 leucine--tRNA ligase [Candidatus Neomarinimicrobiota bacterium]MBT3996886.1 leucine--tRNA ligase [Candidatus Neomarinimicrobiota bacterium]MBT4280850.1 leucine--tRNA ligase [Candidatus Neomarinimicrobiota bacterium]